MEEPKFFAGIDPGEEHEVVLLDAAGRELGQRRVVHSGQGLRDVLAWLQTICGESLGQVAVGIETPRGALVEALLAAGARVYALNPKQLDRFRDRHSSAGAKDDRRDAYVAADALRSDRHLFEPVVDFPERVVVLREVGRLRDRLQQQLRRLTNQLRARLLEVWPELLQLSPGADEPWLWSLLERAPTPQQARRLATKTLAALLRTHRIRRITASQLATTLHQPPLPVNRGTWQAAELEIAVLLEQCRLTHRHRHETERRLKALLEEAVQEEEEKGGGPAPSQAAILCSFPGVGWRVASTCIGEASHLLANYPRLRMVAGVAPVTKQSGKVRRVLQRKSHNPRLAEALHHWARNAVLKEAHWRQRYDALRARGQSHARALRQIGDGLLRCLAAAVNQRARYRELPTLPSQEAA